MSFRTVWGFGGVKFEFDSSIEFPKAAGTLWFQQVGKIYTAKNGEQVNLLKGYRAMISVRLWNNNADGSDAILISELFDMISAAHGLPISIYPRYEPTVSSGLEFECILTSDIKMVDISNVAVGQYIDLEFSGAYLIDRIPTFVDNPASYYVIDIDSNTVTDINGNILTMEM